MNHYGFEYYAQVEEIVCDVLNYLGYDAMQDISGLGSSGWLVAFDDKERYDVYLTISRDRQVKDTVILKDVQDTYGQKQMLIVVGVISDKLRKNLVEYPNTLVLDIQNLLYLIGGNGKLYDRLVAALNFAVDDLEPIRPDDRVRIPEKVIVNRVANIRRKLSTWKPSEHHSGEYERLCCDALKTLFAEDLSLWREQEESDAGLFRFDMICKVKRGNNKDFWEMVENYFRSKYIVFEFKNYSGKVTQREIFTTVKYLYVKALRGVAIMISPNGMDAHGEKAIRGILREEGKLILALTNGDLIRMLDMKKDWRTPADYLSDKLDDLLIDLEK